MAWPPVGSVRFGQLRRLEPISSNYGYDRGLPIDRYYVERFLAEHESDIRGVALEFKDDAYLRRFGGETIESSDVMNLEPGHPGTTIVADLASATDLPERFKELDEPSEGHTTTRIVPTAIKSAPPSRAAARRKPGPKPRASSLPPASPTAEKYNQHSHYGNDARDAKRRSHDVLLSWEAKGLVFIGTGQCKSRSLDLKVP